MRRIWASFLAWLRSDDALDPNGSAMRRIRHDDDLAILAREQEEMPRGKRAAVIPEPESAMPVSRYDVEVERRHWRRNQ